MSFAIFPDIMNSHFYGLPKINNFYIIWKDSHKISTDINTQKTFVCKRNKVSAKSFSRFFNINSNDTFLMHQQ